MRRVFDTINPAAPNAGIDVELSQTLPGMSLGPAFRLEKPDGTLVASISDLTGTAGNFFPSSVTLHKLHMPSAPSGDYVVRATTQWLDVSTGQQGQIETTMPIQLQQLQIDYVGFRYNPGVIINGTSRVLSTRYTSEASGTLYIYAKGSPRDLCEDKTAADLSAMNGALVRSVIGSSSSVSQTAIPGTTFADADTACLQFVNGASGVAEKPYSFNVRYLSLPSSGGDAMLALDAPPSVSKASLALVSMPLSSNDATAYDFLNRRQLFTDGDLHQQNTSNSARIGLEQDSIGWLYRLTAPIASDHPAYAALVEGKAPLMVYLKP